MRAPGLAALAALVLLASVAHAADVTIRWDPNPAEEQVTGYLVHYGKTSKTALGFIGYDQTVDVGNVTEYKLALPDDGVVRYVALVAYNQYGLRSDYSHELASHGKILVIPGDPTGNCMQLPAVKPDGTPAKVEECIVDGKAVWRVL